MLHMGGDLNARNLKTFAVAIRPSAHIHGALNARNAF